MKGVAPGINLVENSWLLLDTVLNEVLRAVPVEIVVVLANVIAKHLLEVEETSPGFKVLEETMHRLQSVVLGDHVWAHPLCLRFSEEISSGYCGLEKG